MSNAHSKKRKQPPKTKQNKKKQKQAKVLPVPQKEDKEAWAKLDIIGGVESATLKTALAETKLFPDVLVSLIMGYSAEYIYGSRKCQQEDFWNGLMRRALHTSTAAAFLLPWEAYLVGPTDVWMVTRENGFSRNLRFSVLRGEKTNFYRTNCHFLHGLSRGFHLKSTYAFPGDITSRLATLCQTLQFVCVPLNVTDGKMSLDTFEKQEGPLQRNEQFGFAQLSRVWDLPSFIFEKVDKIKNST